MIIIPAIDIKNGKCVRLLQGRMEAETIFSNDPSAMAEKWASMGAELIHVIDLDGAVKKSPQNEHAIREILARIKVPIQVGGGIRDFETIKRYLSMGVDRVVIGTEAIRNPEFVEQACSAYPGRIVVGIDAIKGMVAIEGWTETTSITAIELAKRFESVGVAAVNFTDILRDGMQSGPNIEETKRLAQSVDIPVVASGGVSVIEDIKNLWPLNSIGVIGVITGRALYSGSLDLKDAIEFVKGKLKF